jgi:hypothetical protein
LSEAVIVIHRPLADARQLELKPSFAALSDDAIFGVGRPEEKLGDRRLEAE